MNLKMYLHIIYLGFLYSFSLEGANLSALLKANSSSEAASSRPIGTYFEEGGIGYSEGTDVSYCKKTVVDTGGIINTINTNNGALCNATTTKYCSNGNCNSNFSKTKIIIFKTVETTNGDIETHTPAGAISNGRNGSDNFCKKTALEYNCHNVHGFISIKTDDEIRDIPTNYNFPTNIPVYSAYQNNFNNLLLMANDWADLLDGTTLNMVDNSSTSIWTFSTSGGILSSSNQCQYSTSGGGTYASSSTNGAFGNAASKTVTFINNGSTTCNTNRRILCICLTNQ